MTIVARWREHGLRAVRRAGWAGGVGAGLLIVALAVGLAGRVSIEVQRDALVAEHARLLRVDPETAAVPVAQTPGERLAAFHAGFAPLRELPRMLTRLHDHADRYALDLERTDYRSADELNTPLVRVSLNVPVSGEFGEIYAWLSALLGDMPELALASLAVRRNDSEVGQVDAELRMAVFVRRAP